MIEQGNGNLLQADVDALVNTVNCVGVMGKGIALQFRQAFPANYEAYVRACAAEQVVPGRMFIHENGALVGPRWIVNFPTKRHWKGKSRLQDIELGLRALVDDIRRLGIRSIAMPPLGCGNGGLDWNDVRPLIERAFAPLEDVRIVLFAPGATPRPEAMPIRTERPKLTRARALMIKLFEVYGRPGYTTSLLEAQKLAYFLQAAGEPLKLRFEPALYGPYAENLNQLLGRLEGHYITGLGDRTQGRLAPLQLIENASSSASAFLLDERTARERLQRVVELIEGYETPYGMELLSTVHWVATNFDGAIRDQDRTVEAVHNWNDRKRAVMRPEHINLARVRLLELGWA